MTHEIENERGASLTWPAALVRRESYPISSRVPGEQWQHVVRGEGHMLGEELVQLGCVRRRPPGGVDPADGAVAQALDGTSHAVERGVQKGVLGIDAPHLVLEHRPTTAQHRQQAVFLDREVGVQLTDEPLVPEPERPSPPSPVRLVERGDRLMQAGAVVEHAAMDHMKFDEVRWCHRLLLGVELTVVRSRAPRGLVECGWARSSRSRPGSPACRHPRARRRAHRGP